MGKTVKKIAKIAVPVALGFAGAGALGYGPMKYAFGMGGYSPGGFSLGGFLGNNAISKVGLGLQAVGAIQNRKYQQDQTGYQQRQVEEQNKATKERNRYNQMLQKRQRLTQIRQARVRQGEVEAATGSSGLGVSGTSSAIGAIGVTGTQTSANLGAINVAQDVGNRITGYNVAAANFGSQANQAATDANMWTNVSNLGGSFMTNQEQIKNIFSG